MTDDLKREHLRRCARKRGFRNPGIADELAQKASMKTGELIISYQCYDCGKWHIGHADLSQILARIPPNGPLCVICGQRIEATRMEKAERQGNIIKTCSKPCAQKLEQQQARIQSMKHPPPAGK